MDQRSWLEIFVESAGKAAGGKLGQGIANFTVAFLNKLISSGTKGHDDFVKNFENWKSNPESIALYLKNRFPFYYIGKAQELNYKMFLDRTSAGFRSQYYSDHRFTFGKIEEELVNKVKEKFVIAVSGDSLSGKTRLVTDLLSNSLNEAKNLVHDSDLIIAPKPELFEKYDFPDITLLEPIYELSQKVKTVYMFFDDFERFIYIEQPNTNVIDFFINSYESLGDKLKLIFTVKNGFEFSALKKFFDETELPDENYEVVKITSDVIKKDDNSYESYKRYLNDYFPGKFNLDDFDGNFASVFGHFRTKRKRFAALKDFNSDTNEYNLMKKGGVKDSILHAAYAVLHCLGLMHNAHNYNYLGYKIEVLYELVEKFVDERFNIVLKQWQFDKALNILEKSDEALNFITTNDNLVFVEEPYLKHIIYDIEKWNKEIFYDEFAFDNKIYKELLELFDQDKKILTQRNFYVRFFNIKIRDAKDYNEVEYLFNRLSEYVIPDIYTFNTLIKKSPDYEKALEWYKKMRELNLTPDEVSYNTLINKSPDYEKALEWLQEMQKNGLLPDFVTFGTLINRFGERKSYRQTKIIKDFLSIFPAKSLKARRFRRLSLHPVPLLLFAEALLSDKQVNYPLVCLLINKISQREYKLRGPLLQRFNQLRQNVKCEKN